MTSPRKVFTSLTHFILEALITTSDIMIDSFFPPNYPEAAFMRNFLSYRWRRRVPSRRSISALLSKLQREGLVRRSGSRRFARWRIMRPGRRAVVRHRKLALEANARTVFSKRAGDGVIRIVTFDVPERERKKRNVLRECLKMVGFRQLQKSVWVGSSPLPEDLIRYLEERNILDYVHIASLSEHGTVTVGEG